MKNCRAAIVLCLVVVVPLAATAADWSSTSISYLAGSGYELRTEDAAIITLEHASGWRYGDNFFFFDAFQPFADETSLYGEWHPRFSLGKITGQDFSFGPVKDVLVATELNVGNGWRAYFYGLGFDLDLPHFQFFALNFFVRDDKLIANDQTFQISPSWNLPFRLGATSWQFRGFLDYAGAEGDGKANLLAQPQLLVDAGSLFGEAKGDLWLGVEYLTFSNKFGLDGVDENVLQFMGKWVF